MIATLRINGVSAREHPVSTELLRVRQYFEKIKTAENPPAPRENSLNKEAAIRFLKSDLVCVSRCMPVIAMLLTFEQADNAEVGKKLGEQLTKEREKTSSTATKGNKKRSADSSDKGTQGSAKASKRSKTGRSGAK